LECPLRFARALAQHTALMLNRLEIAARNKASKAAVRRLEERLETRKAVSRAAGILARGRNVTRERAVLLFLRHARESRKSPLELARTTILSSQTGRPS
jgi:AmiR/NasT family two-component response regulator